MSQEYHDRVRGGELHARDPAYPSGAEQARYVRNDDGSVGTDSRVKISAEAFARAEAAGEV